MHPGQPSAEMLRARLRESHRTIRAASRQTLGVITAAARALTAADEPDDVITAALQLSIDLVAPSLPHRRRAVYLVVEGDKARVRVLSDKDGRISTELIRLVDHPYLQQVISTGAPIRTRFDADAVGDTVRSSLDQSRITHGAAVPIFVDEQLHGVLGVGGHGTPIREFDRLIYLGSMVALALTNAVKADALRIAAVTDPLTGCLNRRGLQLAVQVASNRREFGVVVADVDGLKPINDRQGHQAGDALLRRFGQMLRGHVRDGDVVARIGGDEFVVLLHDSDIHGTREFCRRLLEALTEASDLRVSLGITVAPGAQHIQAAIDAADAAMYAAKADGGMTYAVEASRSARAGGADCRDLTAIDGHPGQ